MDTFKFPIDEIPKSHCDSRSLTDGYGLAIQAVLAGLAFASLIVKRLYFEPTNRRRTWTVWFFDTSKQGVGAGVIHFLNVFLAVFFHQKKGDPCTWYVVSFLLDSTLGLLMIYCGVRFVSYVAAWKDWSTLRFGEYGQPPKCQAWLHQCTVFMGIIVVEKIVVTVMLEFQFWRHLREIVLSPITDPRLEVTIVMLIIPFFVNTFIFWVVDSFTMRRNYIDDDDCVESGSISKKRKNGRLSIRNYIDEKLDRQYEYENSECNERLLIDDDIFESQAPESNSGFVPKENDGLLARRESNVHLRLNSVSLM